MPLPEEENRPSSFFKADKRGHSRKPEETYAIIEKMYPRRKYLELFARPETKRDNWIYWGDEVTSKSLAKPEPQEGESDINKDDEMEIKCRTMGR